MATKRMVWVANLKFDLKSESYHSIFAIMHFCDAFYSKIKIIQVSFFWLSAMKKILNSSKDYFVK